MGQHLEWFSQDSQQSLVPLPVTLKQQAREEIYLCSKHFHPSSDYSLNISATALKEVSSHHAFINHCEGSSPGPSYMGSLLILITLTHDDNLFLLETSSPFNSITSFLSVSVIGLPYCQSLTEALGWLTELHTLFHNGLSS